MESARAGVHDGPMSAPAPRSGDAPLPRSPRATDGVDAEGHYVPPEAARLNGLVVLIGVVVIGLASGAGYFFYKSPRLRAETERQLAEAPSTPAGRLAFGAKYLVPQIHNRLLSVRISRQQPWIPTHTIRVAGDDGPPEVWGIDVDALGQDVAYVDGLELVIRLPAPSLIARTVLVGDKARSVPAYAAGAAVPDPTERLHELVDFFFDRMADQLSHDIEGTRLVVEIGGKRLPLGTPP